MSEASPRDAGSVSGNQPIGEQSAQVEEDPAELYPSPTVRHEIEIILARQLAGYLALPILVVDPSHTVLYYNEPAELMLGRRFDEGGPVPWTDWSKSFALTDEDGEQLPSRELPTAVALERRQLAHRTLWLRGLDGIRHHVSQTAVPLIGNAGRFLGAIAFFTEIE